jgi:hypothetical protein
VAFDGSFHIVRVVGQVALAVTVAEKQPREVEQPVEIVWKRDRERGLLAATVCPAVVERLDVLVQFVESDTERLTDVDDVPQSELTAPDSVVEGVTRQLGVGRLVECIAVVAVDAPGEPVRDIDVEPVVGGELSKESAPTVTVCLCRRLSCADDHIAEPELVCPLELRDTVLGQHKIPVFGGRGDAVPVRGFERH